MVRTHLAVLASLAPLISLGCGPTQGGPSDAGADTAPADGGCAQLSAESWDKQSTRLDGTNTNVNRSPRIGVDGAGNAIVVWEQQTAASSTSWTVWASQRSAAGSWSPAKQIDGTGATGIPTEPLPSLAVSSSGSAVVVYQTASTGGPQPTNVTYAFYSASTGWGAPTAFFPPTIGANVTGNENPQVAIDSKGNAIAVWAQDMGDMTSTNPDFNPQTYVARSAGGQPFGKAVLLSDYTVNGAVGNPHVAQDEHGNAVVVWQASPANSPIRVMAASFDGTAWSKAGFIDAAPAQSNAGIQPRVAMDGNGNALAVWSQKQGSNIPAYSARWSAGAWAAAVQLDASLNTNLNASNVRVELDAKGIGTAVWQNISNDASHPNDIIVARNSAGTWGPATPIDTAKPGDNYRPAMAIDDGGDVLVVWDDQASVFAAHSDAASGSFGPEVNIDPQDTGADRPDVAFVHGCPNAIAVYSSTTSGGNGSGIFAQLLR